MLDSSEIINDLPLSGNGNAYAMIDIIGHKLLEADMFFSTPVCTLSTMTVKWEESAEFKAR